MQCSGQEYEKLVSEVVIKLWSCVSTSKDVEVISAALKYVNISILNLHNIKLKGNFFSVMCTVTAVKQLFIVQDSAG
jgi:hypothetical protein